MKKDFDELLFRKGFNSGSTVTGIIQYSETM